MTGRYAALGVAAVAAWAAACCGIEVRPPTAERLGLEAPAKEMDRAHERIAASGAGRLWAGAAAVDVTTDIARTRGLYLGGFDFARRNEGVRDPVYARALFLDDGVTPLVVVAVDNIGMLNGDVQAARALATERWGDRVIVASTHDHVGPDTVGFWGCAAFDVLPVCSGRDSEYMVRLIHGIAQAIDLAARSARPAKVRTAVGRMDPALCLNIHDEIEDRKDDTVRVLSLEGEDGAPIATVANWGCHAEAMWNDTQLSADWPGVFYRKWAEEVGGVGIFVEGAQGGLIAPNVWSVLPGQVRDPEKSPGDFPIATRVALMEHIGTSLFATVRASLAAAGPAVGPDGIAIATAAARVEIAAENPVFRYMVSRGIPPREVRFDPDGQGAWTPTDLVAARLRHGGVVLADLATIPGEPAPTVVEDLDAQSTAALKLNVALGNDEIGYIVREADWDLPYYEYERSMSMGPRTGTTVVETIRKLREKL